MPVYQITTDIGSPAAPTFYSFEEIAALSLSSGDKAYLRNDITLRGLADGDVITLPTGVIFEGNNKTIYMSDTAKERGLFTITGGTIQNLTVDFAGKSYTLRRSLLLNQDQNSSAEYGTFNNINLINGAAAQNGGVIGISMGDASNAVTINSLYSNVSTNNSGSAMLAYVGNNFSINDSYFINSYPIITFVTSTGINNQINGCYVYGNIGDQRQLFQGINGNANISNSYFISNNALIQTISSGGGIINVTLENCYMNIASTKRVCNGVNNANDRFNINNCYITTEVGETLPINCIANSNNGIITVTDTYINNTNDFTIAPGTVNVSGGNTSDITVIEEATSLPNWDFSTVWAQGTSDTDAPAYPILRNFQDATVWDGTYINYLDQPTLRAGQSSGDPHVFTLTKQQYDYEYCGFSRFFDSGVDDPNRLIINCEIDESDNKRWSHMSYYNKLYIKYKDSELLIDMGYRGRPIRILKEWIKDDDFKFEMNEEGFSKRDHLISKHCMNCDYTTKCDDDADQHVMDNCHTLLPLVRNSIKFNIPNYYLKLENVSCYNRQPGRVFFSTRKKEYNKYSGIVVDKKWKERSRVMHMFDTKSVNDKNEMDENNVGRYTIL